MKPKPPSLPGEWFKHSTYKDIYDIEDWRNPDTHPCPAYFDYLKAEAKRRDDAYSDFLNGKKRSTPRETQDTQKPETSTEHVKRTESTSKATYLLVGVAVLIFAMFLNDSFSVVRTTEIGDIIRNPTDFSNKNIVIRGELVRTDTILSPQISSAAFYVRDHKNNTLVLYKEKKEISLDTLEPGRIYLFNGTIRTTGGTPLILFKIDEYEVDADYKDSTDTFLGYRSWLKIILFLVILFLIYSVIPKYAQKNKIEPVAILFSELDVGRALKKPIFWYLSYIFLILFFNYVSINANEVYSTLIRYIEYPFYLLSAFLGGYIPYRLFKRFEYHEPSSDLQLWLLKIMAPVVTLISVISLFFGLSFFMMSALAEFRKEIGYGISLSFTFLCIGMVLFSGYLMFKYKLRSGVIIHRGDGW